MPLTNKPITTIEPGVGAGLWDHGNTTDEVSKGKRVELAEDKIKARDINELRAYVESLMRHQHSYTDVVGAGSTTSSTTC